MLYDDGAYTGISQYAKHGAAMSVQAGTYLFDHLDNAQLPACRILAEPGYLTVQIGLLIGARHPGIECFER